MQSTEQTSLYREPRPHERLLTTFSRMCASSFHVRNINPCRVREEKVLDGGEQVDACAEQGVGETFGHWSALCPNGRAWRRGLGSWAPK